MRQLDAAVGELPDRRRVRHHQNRVPFGVQLAQQLDHDLLVGFVQISRRLVRENQFRMIDQRARHGHALLLAAGKLRGQMRRRGRPAPRAPSAARASFSSVVL